MSERFGRLVVVGFVGKRLRKKGNFYYWKCVCDCGAVCTVVHNELTSAGTRSCGCLLRDVMIERNKNLIRKPRKKPSPPPPEYNSWRGMHKRCYDPKHDSFCYYGGRGITVCKRWRHFSDFLSDMGPKPSSKHSIDRIDNQGSYCPENCRWATLSEQNRNRRAISRKAGLAASEVSRIPDLEVVPTASHHE